MVQFRLAAVSLLGAALLFGCNESDGAPALTGLSCDVERVLAENCHTCHTSRPRFGAPMPLVTHADLMKPAVSQPTLAVWEMMALRTHDEETPMPPSGMLGDAQLSVLDAYFEAGLPRDDARTEPCADIPPPPPLEEPLPCEVTHTFRASAGPAALDEGYTLDPAAGNLIQCFVFDSPFREGSQGVGFAPIIDDERVLHHWILWSTAEPLAHGSSFDCTGGMPRDARFIDGWAPGGGNNVTAPDVGIELPGPGEKLILQVHYWNIAGHADVADRSGVSLCATDGPERVNTAAVHTLGSLDIAVPPRTTDWSTTGECRPELDGPVTVVGSGPHMHNFGRSIRTEILRGGDPERTEVLMAVDAWDFNNQKGIATPTVIMPGDVLRTTCTYDNPTDQPIFFGERTEDEMCFNFVLAYPPGALSSALDVSGGRLCLDPPLDEGAP